MESRTALMDQEQEGVMAVQEEAIAPLEEEEEDSVSMLVLAELKLL
jgi:hypothetical protein